MNNNEEKFQRVCDIQFHVTRVVLAREEANGVTAKVVEEAENCFVIEVRDFESSFSVLLSPMDFQPTSLVELKQLSVSFISKEKEFYYMEIENVSFSNKFLTFDSCKWVVIENK